jgi:Sec-independent protein translocase protein TatA
MSKSRPSVTCGWFLISLTALLSWSVPCRADDPDPAEAIRQIGIMARVLETRLNEEMPGAIVSGSIFQPGGVRGFRVPGVGVVFEINVSFPVAEPKGAESASEPGKGEDLWNRIERGEIVGPGATQGVYNFYRIAPAAPPVPPYGVPAPATVPVPSGMPGAPVASASTGVPASPAVEVAPAPPVAATAPAPTGPTGAPGAPIQPAAPVGVSAASGYGGGWGGGGYGAGSGGYASGGPAYGASTGGYGGGYGGGRTGYGPGPYPRQNVETLERVVLDALARYGERLKAIPADENIIVLVAGGGGRGGAVYHYTRATASVPQPERAGLEDLGKALDEMKQRMKDAENQMREAQKQMEAGVHERQGAVKMKAKAKDDAAATEEAEAQIKVAEEKIKDAGEQMKAAGEQLKVARPERTAPEIRATRREASVSQPQPAVPGMPYSYTQAGPGGGGSWVLKVKKGDLVSDPDQLRKRVVIESY